MNANVAVYAGHFDPFTLGHLNIVQRAEKVFERVIVAVAEDSPKKAMFTSEERVELIKDVFKGSKQIEVDRFNGLLISYLRRKRASILIRGIRTVSDFEYEYQMALANKTLAEDIETFFMMTEGSYSYLSSTVIKEIARLGGDISHMVPKEIARRLREKYEAQ
ncbi:MAG: pantetheine-phosphate adenylyltransferase [Pseudomonadota bacterium]